LIFCDRSSFSLTLKRRCGTRDCSACYALNSPAPGRGWEAWGQFMGDVGARAW
jgi:hypothetical protein